MSMCLWLLTACLGMTAPGSQPYISVPIVTGAQAPPPIILPTTLAPLTPVPTTAAPTTASTLRPIPTIPPVVTIATTTAATTTTARPATLPPLTPVPTIAPTPFPLIDPRIATPPPLKLRDPEPLLKFGEEDYVDVVIEANGGEETIIFPKTKRSVSDRSIREKRQTNCGCFLPSQCVTNTDGTGLIDFRIVSVASITTCSAGLRYCCGSTSSPQVSCGSRLQSVTSYPIQAGQAKYGDYPWMVVIMTLDNQYIGGGILIDMQNVLTAAHRISAYPNGQGLKVRLGEWDVGGNYEQYPYRDLTISRVWTHESFNPNTLQNDISLIRMVGGVPTGSPGIVPVCLPSIGQSFDGMRCWVSGWGKDAFGTTGRYQTVLKAVDVPIIPAASCETSLRTTRLGTAYMLDRTAFICAGAEASKDSCTGDGGSGLVCETSTGRWTVAGIVAWGLGCATQGVPAAYVNVVNYLPWIQARQVMAI